MNITPKKMRVGNSARPASRELAGAKRFFIGEGMRQYFQTLVQEVVKKWKGFVRVLRWGVSFASVVGPFASRGEMANGNKTGFPVPGSV
jgi:hypothetical protein